MGNQSNFTNCNYYVQIALWKLILTYDPKNNWQLNFRNISRRIFDVNLVIAFIII